MMTFSQALGISRLSLIRRMFCVSYTVFTLLYLFHIQSGCCVTRCWFVRVQKPKTDLEYVANDLTPSGAA